MDNEAMQLLKSILPDKIIARIQGVSWRQQASKHTREPAVTLTHLRKHSMRTCNGVSSCLSQRLSFSKPHGGAYLDCSLQGQKFIADSHQRVTVMFSGEEFWGQCIMLLQHNSPMTPLCQLWLLVHSSALFAGLPPSIHLHIISRFSMLPVQQMGCSWCRVSQACSCCRHCWFHPTQLQSSHS